jgi:hypothetical protein
MGGNGPHEDIVIDVSDVDSGEEADEEIEETQQAPDQHI